MVLKSNMSIQSFSFEYLLYMFRFQGCIYPYGHMGVHTDNYC